MANPAAAEAETLEQGELLAGKCGRREQVGAELD
jgi:hypothetical protein